MKEQSFPEDLSHITVADAARILGVSASTVRNWAKANLLSFRVSGRSILVPAEDVIGLKQRIGRGDIPRLTTRRNKNNVLGRLIPTGYVNCQAYNAIVELAVEIAKEMTSEYKIRLILLELALHLIAAKEKNCGKSDREIYSDCFWADPDSFAPYTEQLYLLQREKVSLNKRDRLLLLQLANQPIDFIPGEDLLGLAYMALTNLSARKTAGRYYTPANIVDELVSYSLALTKARLPLTIDPCCGSGNFLLKLYIALRSRLMTGSSCSVSEIEALLAGKLFGYDIDSIAILLCRINLLLVASNAACIAPHISVQARNSLHTVWEDGPYDLVLGNPPWGCRFSAEQMASLQKQYCTAPTRESFAIFLEQGLKQLKPDGVLSYVLPQSLLNVQLYTCVRKLLVESTKIKRIRLLGNSFRRIYAPAIALSCIKKNPDARHLIMVSKAGRSREIAQQRFAHNQQHIFNILATDADQNLICKMKRIRGNKYLQGEAKFALGIVTGNNRQFVLKQPLPGAEVILRGNDVYKYNLSPGKNYIIFTPDRFQQVAPTWLYRAEEKLIYRFINKHLIFAYDNQQTLSLNSANILIPNLAGASLKYVLAVLNSRCAQFFFNRTFASVKILRKHIESIPIPPCSTAVEAELTDLVESLIETERAGARRELYDAIEEKIMVNYEFNSAERAHIHRAIKGYPFLNK